MKNIPSVNVLVACIAALATAPALAQTGDAFDLKWNTIDGGGRTSTGGVYSANGTNFTGATSVLFNGASATFTNAPTNNLDLRITAIVPPDAISGPITIVTPHGSVTSTASFQVLPPPLTI